AGPAARSAATSAWGPPGGAVAPSNVAPSGVTRTAPTHGFGAVVRRTRCAAAMACRIQAWSAPPVVTATSVALRDRSGHARSVVGRHLRQQVEGVRQDVEHGGEAFARPPGRAGGVEDDGPPPGAGHRPRQPPGAGVDGP